MFWLFIFYQIPTSKNVLMIKIIEWTKFAPVMHTVYSSEMHCALEYMYIGTRYAQVHRGTLGRTQVHSNLYLWQCGLEPPSLIGWKLAAVVSQSREAVANSFAHTGMISRRQDWWNWLVCARYDVVLISFVKYAQE